MERYSLRSGKVRKVVSEKVIYIDDDEGEVMESGMQSKMVTENESEKSAGKGKGKAMIPNPSRDIDESQPAIILPEYDSEIYQSPRFLPEDEDRRVRAERQHMIALMDARHMRLKWKREMYERKKLKFEECDGSSPWPPVWKPFNECPLYVYGLIDKYVDGTWANFDWWPYGSKPTKDHLAQKKSTEDRVNKFINNIMESRGYDVDEKFACYPLSPLDQCCENLHRNPHLTIILKFIIDEINAQAQAHGESYVLHKFEKTVDGKKYAWPDIKKIVRVKSNMRILLYTFTVEEVAPNAGAMKTVQAMVFIGQPRELEEWRFKPQG